MKLKTRVFLFLIIALLTCTEYVTGQDAAWTRYTNPGEEFSVELPSMPSLFNTVRAGDIRLRQSSDLKVRVFSLYHEGVVYFIVAYDAPRQAETLDFFAASLRGAWGLARKGPLTLGGFEGSTYSVVGTQRGRLTYDLRGEGRVFRTNRHAYLVLAVTQEDGRPEVGRFLDSFALGSNPTDLKIAEEEPVPRYVAPKTPDDVTTETAGEAAQRLKLTGGRRALIVYKPEPPYTEEARKKRVNGRVSLRALLSSTGRVTEIKAINPLPNGLTESAIRVARQMRFFPAEVDGQPVSQWVMLEYNFNIY